MDPKVIRGYLDLALTDTCNRYLNAVDELGVVDRRARAKFSSEILSRRNELLDKWVPFYAEHIANLVDEALAKDKPANPAG